MNDCFYGENYERIILLLVRICFISLKSTSRIRLKTKESVKLRETMGIESHPLPYENRFEKLNLTELKIRLERRDFIRLETKKKCTFRDKKINFENFFEKARENFEKKIQLRS